MALQLILMDSLKMVAIILWIHLLISRIFLVHNFSQIFQDLEDKILSRDNNNTNKTINNNNNNSHSNNRNISKDNLVLKIPEPIFIVIRMKIKRRNHKKKNCMKDNLSTGN